MLTFLLGGGGYLVAVLSVFAGVLLAVVCSGLLYWRQQRRLTSSRGVLGSLGLGLGPEPCHSRANLRSHDDEKSNNLQNEENLRRYTNPLKEEGMAIGGSLANLRTSTSHHSGLKVSAASVSDLQNPRVSVVRPMSASMSIASLCASDAEIIEMLGDKEKNHQLPAQLAVAAAADCELYKAASPEMRNNTNAALAPQKDLNKQGMSLSVCPVHRTFDQVDRTVLV